MALVRLFSSAKKLSFTVALLLLGFGVYAQPTYCTSGLGGAAYDAPIDSVVIPGTTLNNSTPANPYTYSAFPISGSTTAHLQQGGTYTIAVNSTSSYFANIGMWIDFNRNGTFDVFEWFSVGTNIMGTAEVTFTVPSTAHTGLTGLRIRTQDASFGSVYAYDACTAYSTGETEDYYVSIDTTLPCSGTPAVGSITGPANVCPSYPVALSLTGYTVSSGLTYQWQSRPAGVGSFTSIAGATNSTYTATSIAASTDYHLVITCTASTLSSTSATATVALNPAYMCYCHDSTSLGGSDYYIQLDSVAIAGTTLNNYTPSNPHIYSSFPASGSTTAHMSQGATYTIAVNSGFMEPAYVGMWIDYDHSGTFDPGEFTTVGTGLYYGTQSVSFTVPLTALTGQTGLRIRNSGFLSSTDACSYEGDGETEDYIISIDTTYPCAGVPVAGTISGPDSVCSAQEFVLTASGYTIATGLTFQWLSMPAGAGSFTAIPGATSATLVVYGQPVATDYEFEVTCSGSAISVYTVKYTASELPFTRCYCDSASLGGTTYYAPIDSVGIVGTTLTNNTPFNPNTYSVYPASGTTTATLQQGTYYTIAVKSTTGGDAASSYVWVDYNHDGVYDAGEATLVGSSVLGVASAELYIPATALTGQTGLRVRTVDPMDDFIGAGDACTDLFSGETEDYLITIDTTYPCTGTPLAGSVSGPSGICPSSAFNLMLAGYTNGTGITIAWQQSPAGAGSFTTIPGATAPIYASTGITTATDYRVVVTCSGSGLSATTATVTVSVNPFINCYCSPATGTTLVYGGQTEVLKGTIAGTTFNSTAFTVSYATGYEQVSPALLQNTAVLHLGHTYAYTLIMDTALYYPSAAGVWIDYDHNGVFESSEYTGFGSDLYGGTYTGDVTVPAGSLTGQTGMRIAASDEYIDPSIACNTIYYGEIADFIITIEAGGTYVAPVANADFTVRAFPNPAGRSVTISTTGTPGDNRTILLTDVTGRIVTKVTAVGNKTELDLEGLATGMYLVKYEDDQHVAVIKINKQ